MLGFSQHAVPIGGCMYNTIMTVRLRAQFHKLWSLTWLQHSIESIPDQFVGDRRDTIAAVQKILNWGSCAGLEVALLWIACSIGLIVGAVIDSKATAWHLHYLVCEIITERKVGFSEWHISSHNSSSQNNHNSLISLCTYQKHSPSMPVLQCQNMAWTIKMTILATQATACSYGILQYSHEKDCMVIWYM